jgi:hypothetical protein
LQIKMSLESLTWNRAKEKCFDLDNKRFQNILFSKLACIWACFQKILLLTLPHHSNRVSKLQVLKSLGKKTLVNAKRFHQNDFKLRVPATSKPLFPKSIWKSL